MLFHLTVGSAGSDVLYLLTLAIYCELGRLPRFALWLHTLNILRRWDEFLSKWQRADLPESHRLAIFLSIAFLSATLNIFSVLIYPPSLPNFPHFTDSVVITALIISLASQPFVLAFFFGVSALIFNTVET